MRDTELYRNLLGLESPWTVAKVNLDVNIQRVDVHVEHPKGEKWPCPVFGDLLPVYDHSEERVWRHLDSCQRHGTGPTQIYKRTEKWSGIPSVPTL